MKKAEFKQKVGELAEKLRVSPREIHMRDMTNKWASCSSKGRLTFDYEILELGDDLQHYVIVHELLHLQIKNHGKLFKSLMKQHCPNYIPQEKFVDIIKSCHYGR